MAKKRDVKMVVNIGTPSGKTEKLILENNAQVPLYGYNVGDEIDGSLLGDKYEGYVFKIKGGSDHSGFPLRGDLEGNGYHTRLLSKGVGYQPKEKGIRKRKRVRGREIQDHVAQLNCVIVKEGANPLS